MKASIKALFILPLLLAVLGLEVAIEVEAQTFTTLHSFSPTPSFASGLNDDGAFPVRARLVLSGTTLYGTAAYGGDLGYGTVFAADANGMGFTNLHTFSGSVTGTYDGDTPYAGLVLLGTTLYGLTTAYDAPGNGTVFSINADGTGFMVLHDFTGTNSVGCCPYDGLTLWGNTLFGTASGGGLGSGTVFKVNTDGTGFTTIYMFTVPRTNALGVYTNSDGFGPNGQLVLSGSTLYGTASGTGGVGGVGTVFALNTDGTGFTTLHSFTATSGTYPGPYINSDGAYPNGGLVLSGNTLYGTTEVGGSSGNGTVFKVNTDGTGFATLHQFSWPFVNSDGAQPQAGLVLSGSTLYGTTQSGGTFGNGAVFSINIDGTGFTNLYSFTQVACYVVGLFFEDICTNSDGVGPASGLILSGNTLYGTAESGGLYGNGTIFSISLPAQLTITPSGGNVILTWPTNAITFILQSTTNLSTAAWTTNLPAPFIVNGQYTVTSPISGTQQFFRLSQ